MQPRATTRWISIRVYRCSSAAPSFSSGESRLEMRDVAVVHHVFLALQAQLSRRADGRFGFMRLQIRQRVNLRLDEALLQVVVHRSGGLGGFGADGNRPGSNLFRPGGEEAVQPKQLV